MTTRMNVSVDDDVPAMLDELAGPRGKGELISQLVRQHYHGQQELPDVEAMNVEALRLQLMGLTGRVTALEGRVQRVEVRG